MSTLDPNFFFLSLVVSKNRFFFCIKFPPPVDQCIKCHGNGLYYYDLRVVYLIIIIIKLIMDLALWVWPTG